MNSSEGDAEPSRTRIHYDAAPLQEAVCEFIFGEESSWDLTVPGNLYSALRSHYSLAPESIPGGDILVERTRIELRSPNSTEYVRFGENVLSVHVGLGYISWEAFKSRIEDALLSYLSIAAPKRIARLRIRYSNLIEFPNNVRLDEYFLIGFRLPALPIAYVFNLMISLDTELQAIPDGVLKIVLASAPAKTPTVAIKFDVEVYEKLDEAATCDSILSHVEAAKREISTTFELSITDQLRAMFKHV